MPYKHTQVFPPRYPPLYSLEQIEMFRFRLIFRLILGAKTFLWNSHHYSFHPVFPHLSEGFYGVSQIGGHVSGMSPGSASGTG